MKLNNLNYSAVGSGKELRLHTPPWSFAQFLQPNGAEDEWLVPRLHVMAEVPTVCAQSSLQSPWDSSWEEEPLSAHCGLLGEKALIVCDYNVPSDLNMLNSTAAFALIKDCKLSNGHYKWKPNTSYLMSPSQLPVPSSYHILPSLCPSSSPGQPWAHLPDLPSSVTPQASELYQQYQV